MVPTGFTADLIIVDGNPHENLGYPYAFGALDMVDGKIVRRGGIREAQGVDVLIASTAMPELYPLRTHPRFQRFDGGSDCRHPDSFPPNVTS
jgi:hypothetical protein